MCSRCRNISWEPHDAARYASQPQALTPHIVSHPASVHPPCFSPTCLLSSGVTLSAFLSLHPMSSVGLEKGMVRNQMRESFSTVCRPVHCGRMPLELQKGSLP